MKDEIFKIISESESEYKERVLDLLREYTHLFSAFIELRELDKKYKELTKKREELIGRLDNHAAEKELCELKKEICEYEDKVLVYEEIAPYFAQIDNVFNYLARQDHARLLRIFEGSMDYKLAADIFLFKADGDFENVFLKPLLMLHNRCIRIPLL